jgi:hypothetical protein
VGFALVVALLITDFIMGFISPALAMIPLTGIFVTIVFFAIYAIVLGLVAVFVLRFVGLR